ncbi:MAG TPA: hypothetical protein GX511_04570 [Firmicutes bacterium]|nr:hypothetical protein [Bacillota bacterium]
MRTCYLPRRVTTSRTYAQLLTALEEKKALVREARTGVTLDLQQPGVKAEFLGPVRTDYEDLNNVSAVLKVTYGKTAFLFMGDASAAAEKDLLRLGNLQADVLKVGHHGSSSATGAAFLHAVRPQVAVISVGKSNDYGHPSQATLRRLAAAQVKVWRTDHTGNIIVTSSGTKIDVKGEKASADR